MREFCLERKLRGVWRGESEDGSGEGGRGRNGCNTRVDMKQKGVRGVSERRHEPERCMYSSSCKATARSVRITGHPRHAFMQLVTLSRPPPFQLVTKIDKKNQP